MKLSLSDKYSCSSGSSAIDWGCTAARSSDRVPSHYLAPARKHFITPSRCQEVTFRHTQCRRLETLKALIIQAPRYPAEPGGQRAGGQELAPFCRPCTRRRRRGPDVERAPPVNKHAMRSLESGRAKELASTQQALTGVCQLERHDAILAVSEIVVHHASSSAQSGYAYYVFRSWLRNQKILMALETSKHNCSPSAALPSPWLEHC